MDKPIIYLAFANDQDAYLPMINRERKNIYRSLRRHHDEGLIRVEKEATSSLEDIFEVFNAYPDQVAIFHYGGHAGGTHLRLENPDSSPQKAFALEISLVSPSARKAMSRLGIGAFGNTIPRPITGRNGQTLTEDEDLMLSASPWAKKVMSGQEMAILQKKTSGNMPRSK